MRQLEQGIAKSAGATVHCVAPSGRQQRQYVYRGQSLESLLRCKLLA